MNKYLQKHALYPTQINQETHENLGIIIVIPCYNEESLIPVFESLKACSQPEKEWEVIAVVNSSENADDQILTKNEQCYLEVKEWIWKEKQTRFHVLHFPSLLKKHAGVGLARKIGMDEAVRRLADDGIIVNLDVDCTVSENYLTEIEGHFSMTNCDGASIHFEHPLKDITDEIEHAIVQYELYLRYFINMQKLIGFPWAFQTIGSAMAVRSHVYQKQGGMNRRKAGEDFYFLQKVIELGRFSELNTATVFASPRKSDRVPFGTGKAVNDITQNNGNYSAYHPKSFQNLKALFTIVPELYKRDDLEIANSLKELLKAISTYLESQNWKEKLISINKLTSTKEAFIKRFFREFNAFQLMKFCHYSRDHFHPDISVEKAIEELFDKLQLPHQNTLKNSLLVLREYDRSK